MAKESDTHARMTSQGVRKACNYITDLMRGRKDAVTFYIDGDGQLKELGSGGTIELRRRGKKSSK